jgi:hypothetical protein
MKAITANALRSCPHVLKRVRERDGATILDGGAVLMDDPQEIALDAECKRSAELFR